jgi:hypothetical protein
VQVGCWRCGEWRIRTRKYTGKRVRYNKGDPYFQDLIVDARLYCQMVENLLLPRLKELRQTVWDASNGTTDYDLNIQHDGAPGHKAEGIEEYLASLFLPVRGNWVRQPAKSPCTNMLDMAVFHAVSSIVARHDYQNKEQLHVAVEQAFNELPTETLDMQWACKAILMRQFVDNKGKHVPPAHVGLRKSRTEGGHAGLWQHVHRYTSTAHPPAPQNQ